jgi:hypothetical protein
MVSSDGRHDAVVEQGLEGGAGLGARAGGRGVTCDLAARGRRRRKKKKRKEEKKRRKEKKGEKGRKEKKKEK